MKPLDGNRDNTSPSSSYLLKTDLDDDDDDDDGSDDVGLSRSIISDAIEGRDLIDNDRWASTSATGALGGGGGGGLGGNFSQACQSALKFVFGSCTPTRAVARAE